MSDGWFYTEYSRSRVHHLIKFATMLAEKGSEKDAADLEWLLRIRWAMMVLMCSMFWYELLSYSTRFQLTSLSLSIFRLD